MAFSDWTVFVNGLAPNGGQPAGGVSTSFFGGSSALVFSGSGLSIPDVGGSTASGNAVPSTIPHGFTSGKIRTLINPVISGPANHGLCCMQSVSNMQGGVGAKGYAVMLDSILFQNKVVLARMNDGSSASIGGALGTTYSLLGQSGSGLWVGNNVYCIEIEWHVNTLIPGVHIIGRFGSMTDFSDLTIFAEAFDATSHSQLITVGEGPYVNKSTNTMTIAFDNTQLFSMTP